MSVRLRRLYAEHERLKALFANHARIRIVEAIGDPPDRYVVEYHVKGLTETKDGAIEERYLHRVQITLGPNYPKDMPTCVILGTPVFHPNIDHLAVCTEDVSAAGRTLDHTIVFIGELITFQAYNLQSPRNGDAAHWTEQNLSRLPLETVDLFPRPLLEGAAIPVTRAGDVYTRPMPPEAPSQREIRCGNCGKTGPAAGLRECSGHHVACSDCAIQCGNCARTLCALCDVHSCVECRRPVCVDCFAVCSHCNREICPAHVAQCPVCAALRCNTCSHVCRGCGWRVCGEHLDRAGLCPSCRKPNAGAPVNVPPVGPGGTAQYPVASAVAPEAPESRSTVAVVELAPQQPHASAPGQSEPKFTLQPIAQLTKEGNGTMRQTPPPPVGPQQPAGRVVITAEEAMVVPESALRPPNQFEIAPPAGPETSGKAVASLVFGIAAVPLLGLLVGWFAVLFGALAFRDINRNPRLRGRKMASYGISFGAFGIVVWLVLLIVYGSYFFGPREQPLPVQPPVRGNPRVQHVYAPLDNGRFLYARGSVTCWKHRSISFRTASVSDRSAIFS
jgi:ubiquitin-protein ligase